MINYKKLYTLTILYWVHTIDLSNPVLEVSLTTKFYGASKYNVRYQKNLKDFYEKKILFRKKTWIECSKRDFFEKFLKRLLWKLFWKNFDFLF